MRPMPLAFPGDRGAAHVDTQYLLGADLLVAPVLRPGGVVEVYLPAGRWTNWFTGEVVDAGHGLWRTEVHDVLSLPLYVREGAVIPVGGRDDRPDHDYLDGLVLRVFPGGEGDRTVTVTTPDGEQADFVVTRQGGAVSVATTASGWQLEQVGTAG
jgi:alpha-D-xyloside xylohydrolase